MSKEMSLASQMGLTQPDKVSAEKQKRLLDAQRVMHESLMENSDFVSAKNLVEGWMNATGAKTPEEAVAKIYANTAANAEKKKLDEERLKKDLEEVALVQMELAKKRAAEREAAKAEREAAKKEDLLKEKLLREAISKEMYDLQQMEQLSKQLSEPEYQPPQPPQGLAEDMYAQFMASRGKAEGLAQGKAEEQIIDEKNQNEAAPEDVKTLFAESAYESDVNLPSTIAQEDAPDRSEAGGMFTLADLMRNEQKGPEPPSEQQQL